MMVPMDASIAEYGGRLEVDPTPTDARSEDEAKSERVKSDSEGSSSSVSVKTVASPPPVEPSQQEEQLPPLLPRRSMRKSSERSAPPVPIRPQLSLNMPSTSAEHSTSASDFLGIPSPSPPPRKRRSESASRVSRRDADEIDLSRLDALQRQSWVVNPKRSSMAVPSKPSASPVPSPVAQQNSALQTVVQDLVGRLRLLNEENFCLKRDLMRAKEREKHFREVDEVALRQKIRSMEESYKTSLDEKRQLIKKLNANLSKISEKLNERERSLSELRKEVSSLEKHWTQSRLDCEILQGKLKNVNADCAAAEREVIDLKAELREARQVSLTKSEGDKSELVELMRTVETKNDETLAKLDRFMVAHTSGVDLRSAAGSESGCLVKAMETLVAAMTSKDRDLKAVVEENARLKARLESIKHPDPSKSYATDAGTKIRVDYPAVQRDAKNVAGYKSLISIGPVSPMSSKSAPEAETNEAVLQREIEKLRRELKPSTSMSSNSHASPPAALLSVSTSNSSPATPLLSPSSALRFSAEERLRLVSGSRHHHQHQQQHHHQAQQHLHLHNRGCDSAENGAAETRLERDLSQLRSAEPGKRGVVRESELEVLRREIAGIRTNSDSLDRISRKDAKSEQRKSTEILDMENDVANQLGKISQYVKSHNWDAEKALNRPLSSPVIMSALRAVDGKAKSSNMDPFVASDDIVRLDGRENKENRGLHSRRTRRSYSVVDAASPETMDRSMVHSRRSVSRVEDPNCSLDEIDVDELSEMWTKELEMSFETLAAESSNSSD